MRSRYWNVQVCAQLNQQRIYFCWHWVSNRIAVNSAYFYLINAVSLTETEIYFRASIGEALRTVRNEFELQFFYRVLIYKASRIMFSQLADEHCGWVEKITFPSAWRRFRALCTSWDCFYIILGVPRLCCGYENRRKMTSNFCGAA